MHLSYRVIKGRLQGLQRSRWETVSFSHPFRCFYMLSLQRNEKSSSGDNGRLHTVFTGSSARGTDTEPLPRV